MLIHELYIYSVAVAIIAWVYTVVLVDDEKILFSFKRWIYMHLHPIISKPMISCSECVSGQMGLWLYLYFVYRGLQYNILDHITLISFSIFNICIIIKFRLYGN